MTIFASRTLAISLLFGCSPQPRARDVVGPRPGESTAPLPTDPSVPAPDSAGTLPPGDLDLGWARERPIVRVSAVTDPIPPPPVDAGVPGPGARSDAPAPYDAGPVTDAPPPIQDAREQVPPGADAGGPPVPPPTPPPGTPPNVPLSPPNEPM
jgi:hypothetical protein